MGLKIAEIRTNEALTENKIRRKLESLGCRIDRIYEPEVGSAVTAYPIKLSLDTPINKVLNKEEDIALAIGATSITIQRIENKVVIFVPNEDRTIIKFYDALYWLLRDEEAKNMELPILLGQDFHGNPSCIDLSSQPHLLIAGSTGSGKSVFMSNVISSLYMAKEVDEIEFYLVDTKGLDLNLFENLPNVTNYARTVEEWYTLIDELNNIVGYRTTVLRQTNVRNIKEYNSVKESKMSYIVLIIDELADLIDKDSYKRKEYSRKDQPNLKVSEALRRLIQVCRAVGIHIIAGTQRTSTDIIDGVIKANFPSRISLKLPTATDSRTILGKGGAESLLGLGDMLLKRGDMDNLERFHAPFVDLKDINMILNQREMILQSLSLKQISN